MKVLNTPLGGANATTSLVVVSVPALRTMVSPILTPGIAFTVFGPSGAQKRRSLTVRTPIGKPKSTIWVITPMDIGEPPLMVKVMSPVSNGPRWERCCCPHFEE
jgi:hypothetical protein